MDNRDVLIGVLASALIGTFILWWQSDKPESSDPLGSDQATIKPFSQVRAGAPGSPRTPPPYEPSAARKSPDRYPDLPAESGTPIDPDQVESFRFRPLGQREIERLERQRPSSGPPRYLQDWTQIAPAFDAQSGRPNEYWPPRRPEQEDYGTEERGRGPDAQQFWQGSSSGPYRSTPRWDSSPPDRPPPSQRMYPTLDQPNEEPRADRPLIG